MNKQWGEMFPNADYSLRSRACVMCGRAHVCYSLASLSSKRAQLTPQWGEAGSFRRRYPAPLRSRAVLTDSLTLKMSHRQTLRPLETQTKDHYIYRILLSVIYITKAVGYICVAWQQNRTRAVHIPAVKYVIAGYFQGISKTDHAV